jgi:hypothetical protein
MYPVHDVDAILLLSLSVSAKRRPAELSEIIAATDLAQGVIPNETKLSDAFARLSAYGLIVETDGGYTLSADAQQMMESQRKKDDNEKHIYRLKEHLADYHLQGEHATILVSEAQLLAAIAAHQAAKQPGTRNLLMPKPKAVEDKKRQPYKPFFARKRKD